MGGSSCKLKIILNGGTIASEATLLCYQIQKDGVVIPDDAGYKMVEYLNAAEGLVFQAKRAFLESQEFKGPWPKSMSD